MKTHIVIDEIYTKEEGQDIYVGTLQECEEFVTSQAEMIIPLKIVPMTKEELIINNPKE